MKVLSVRLVVLCTAVFSVCDGAKILGFFPGPSKSHLFLCEALMKGLVARGHEVTVVTPFPTKSQPENYTELVLGDIKTKFFASVGSNLFETESTSMLLKMRQFMQGGLQMSETVLQDDVVQTLLKTKEKFDVVIIVAVMNHAHFALGHHFGIPVIVFSTIGPNPMVNPLVGTPALYGSVPEVFVSTVGQMGFFTRLMNTLKCVLSTAYVHFVVKPQEEVLMKKYFPNAPSLSSILSNTSLVLTNSHVSFGIPRPLAPNMIEIGGFHVDKVRKLPHDLQKYLDESTNGVVYFSMGSNLKSTDMAVEKRDAFIRAFAQIKQNVLWKCEEDALPGQSGNLKLGKWFPQQDILAHPNVKLFISHGGLLSTIESITRGMPMIGIPIFGDQEANMIQAKSLGYAILLEYRNITDESVSWALNEALNNPEYTRNVKHRSKLLADQPVTPLDRATFWVEYIIKHKGAKHLRSASLDLTYIQFLLLDVIGFILLITGLTITVLYFLIRKIFCVIKNGKTLKVKTN